jgi:hypothetical protein
MAILSSCSSLRDKELSNSGFSDALIANDTATRRASSDKL